MAETNSSQSQNTSKASPFNPFNFQQFFDLGAFAGVAESWQKAAADQQARVAAMLEEMAKFEEKSVAEARRAVEEMARLTLASIDYSRELSANFRKMTLEMSQKGTQTASAEKAKKN